MIETNATVVSLKAVALYGLAVTGALTTLLWRSEYGVYLLVVLLPLQTTRYHLHGFPLGSNIVDILLLCTLIGSLLRPQDGLARRSGVLTFLGATCGFYLLSLWRGAFYLGTPLPLWFSDIRLVDYKNFIVMPLLAFAVVRTIKTKQQIVTVIVLCCLTAIAVDYSYRRSAVGRDFAHYAETTRDAGPLGYAGENGLASYLVEATALVLPFAAAKRTSWLRTLALVTICSNTVCILYSYSREAYLALAIVLCAVAIAKVRWLLVPVLLLCIAWQVVLPTAVQERIAMTYTENNAGEAAKLDASAQERVMLWTDAVKLFHENPIVGTGFLTYAHLSRVGSYKDTHNFYLKMLVETGLIGLLLFVVQLILLAREGFYLFVRSNDSLLSLMGLGYACLIVAAAIVNFFGDRWMFIQVNSNLWILLGCVLSASSIACLPAVSQADRKRPRRRFHYHPQEALALTSEVAGQ